MMQSSKTDQLKEALCAKKTFNVNELLKNPADFPFMNLLQGINYLLTTKLKKITFPSKIYTVADYLKSSNGTSSEQQDFLTKLVLDEIQNASTCVELKAIQHHLHGQEGALQKPQSIFISTTCQWLFFSVTTDKAWQAFLRKIDVSIDKKVAELNYLSACKDNQELGPKFH